MTTSLPHAVPDLMPHVEKDAVAQAPAPTTLAAVYEAHASFVLRNVRRLVGPEGPVEDLTQEVFLIVLRCLPAFEARSSMRTWLYGILRNVVRDYWRGAGRIGQRDSVDLEMLPGPTCDPETSASRAQAFLVLDEILKKLDEPKRDVFILAELEKMSAPEISEALGINPTTVYARLRDARRDFELLAKRYRMRAQGGAHE